MLGGIIIDSKLQDKPEQLDNENNGICDNDKKNKLDSNNMFTPSINVYSALGGAIKLFQLKMLEMNDSFKHIYEKINKFNESSSQFASCLGKYYLELLKIDKNFSDGVTNYLNSINRVINENLNTITIIHSKSIEWLQNIVLPQLKDKLTVFGDLLRDLNGMYLSLMYHCHWFPYANWLYNKELVEGFLHILETSRGASKRREKRIDNLIIDYYTPNRIKNMKSNWKKSDLEPHIKKILCQAIDAHLRKEYVLTISCLSSMWETLIYFKAGVTRPLQQKQTKEKFKDLIDENGLNVIILEFYDNFILSHINTTEEVIEGIPNRNGCLHGKYNKYPNVKSSLNAILITDFIISLKPIDNEVDNDNI